MEASFCSNCGTEVVQQSATTDTISTEYSSETDRNEWTSEKDPAESPDEESPSGVGKKQLGVAIGISLIVGIQVAFGFAELGGGGFFFLITLVGVSGYLYRQTNSSKSAFATGLYIVAGWFILAPLLHFLGVAGQGGNASAIGALLGMVIYGFIGLLLAIVTGGLGYFINSKLNVSKDESDAIL